MALLLTTILSLLIMVYASFADASRAFNVVASVIAMFFLCTYGMINLAAFVEAFSGNPSFRPRFRFYHWSTSLVGAFACLAVMLLIDVAAAIVSFVVLAALYFYIAGREYRASFGDARRGFQFSLTVRHLQRLRAMPPVNPKNWRPVFLVLSGREEAHLTLLKLGDCLEGSGRGLVTVAKVLEGDLSLAAPMRETAIRVMSEMLKKYELDAVPEAVIATNMDEGLRLLVQAHSIGPIKPNTVIMGWPHQQERIHPFFEHTRDIRMLGKSILCIIDAGLPEASRLNRRVDVWWRGRENGSLMLILAGLLKDNIDWRRTRIRLLRLIRDEAGRAASQQDLEQILASARVEAEPVVVVSNEPFETVLYTHSRAADLLFAGFTPPAEDAENEFYERMDLWLKSMPTTILSCSSNDADLSA